MSPLDPHNLMQGLDEEPHERSKRLTGRLLRFLGEQFPIGDGKHVVTAPADDSSNLQGFQDLQLFITTIAKQGWTLDERSQARRVRKDAKLPMAELPAEDLRLLQTWTPAALQKVIGDMTLYFDYGQRRFKRDVAPDLDPLQRGLLNEERASKLLDTCVYPRSSLPRCC